MVITAAQTHDERVNELRRTLAEDGYSFGPQGILERLPYEPDLVACRGDEIRIVEVVGWHEPGKKERLSAMAAAVKGIPRARFEIVHMLPPDRTYFPEAISTYSLTEYEKRIQEGQRLAGEGHLEAALLALWAAVEGLIRDESMQLDPDTVRQRNPAVLIEAALSLGVVEDSEGSLLRKALQARNTYSHGFRLAGEEEQELRGIVEALCMIGTRLLTSEAESF